MDAGEFTERLKSLTGANLVAIAEALRGGLDCVDGEVAWWRATMAVDAALKRHRLTRQAGLAAHHASQAVLGAARRSGVFDRRRADVTVVARAASDVARMLVVGERCGFPAACTASLLVPWEPMVATAA